MVTAAPSLVPAYLRERLIALSRRAAPREAATLVSVSVAAPRLDPLALFAGCAAADRVYWERPDEGVALAGVGAAWTTETGQPAGAADSWRDLLRDAAIDDGAIDARAARVLAGPLLLGGFAFDPARPATSLWNGFPVGRLVLPCLLVVSAGGVSFLTVNRLVSPGEDVALEPLLSWLEDALRPLAPTLSNRAADHDGAGAETHVSAPAGSGPGIVVADVLARAIWEALVADGAAACRAGRLRKVVLARAVEARATSGAPFDPAAALRRLRRAYPSAYVFAVSREGGRCFLGATPERLARLRGAEADVACLAGSARRGAIRADDERIGAALLASPKNRGEHAAVVEAVYAALSPLCGDLSIPPVPRLVKLANVQHLYTPVRGRVAPGIGVLDLVARLHPTPAVGGTPREEALRYIRDHERLDRGWYAAPVGLLDRHGEGEFAVALRSALLHNDRATLFAGCGIVGDSHPSDEYEETRLKLHPMLAALA